MKLLIGLGLANFLGILSGKLHNEEPHNLYSSQNIIIMIKSRRMRWAEDVVRIGRKGVPVGFWWESHKEDH
jgi:hypothetical protein